MAHLVASKNRNNASEVYTWHHLKAMPTTVAWLPELLYDVRHRERNDGACHHPSLIAASWNERTAITTVLQSVNFLMQHYCNDVRNHRNQRDQVSSIAVNRSGNWWWLKIDTIFYYIDGFEGYWRASPTVLAPLTVWKCWSLWPVFVWAALVSNLHGGNPASSSPHHTYHSSGLHTWIASIAHSQASQFQYNVIWD